MWRLRTAKSDFAVKVLNSTIMQRQNICAIFEQSEQIARTAAAQNIPVLPALTVNGNSVQKIADAMVMLFSWIEGESLPVGTIDVQAARQIGLIVGKMHASNLDASELHPSVPEPIDSEELWALSQQTKILNSALGEELSAAAPSLVAWSLKSNEANQQLSKNLIISHGDIDQKNVLWQNPFSPVIIDWESAGLRNPTVELAALCLDWSGFPKTQPDEEAFGTLLNAYRESNANRTSLDSFDTALEGVRGNWLNWLIFNLRRSITGANQEEQQLGSSESVNALALLRLFEKSRAQWLSWLSRK
jgi:Ser/Thr protein kinase RdoA (MazF antagonist)